MSTTLETRVPHNRRMPDFIIVGAMRAGTTSLARWLGAHSQIHLAPGKEVHYFDRHYERGEDWYTAQFDGGSDEYRYGEATPNYMYDAQAMDRIARDLPDVRIIVSLRDPVQRAYSHYQHRHSRGGEPLSFEDALAAEPQRLASGDPEAKAHFSYVDRGRYLNQILHILDLFPRPQVHIELFERMRDTPLPAFASATTFLGVASDEVPALVGEALNRHQQFRSVRVRQLARKLPARPRNFIGRLNRVETGGYPPMSETAREWLMAQFQPERRALEDAIGLKLDAWDS